MEVGFYRDFDRDRFYIFRDADFEDAMFISNVRATEMMDAADWTAIELATRIAELETAFPGSFSKANEAEEKNEA